MLGWSPGKGMSKWLLHTQLHNNYNNWLYLKIPKLDQEKISIKNQLHVYCKHCFFTCLCICPRWACCHLVPRKTKWTRDTCTCILLNIQPVTKTVIARSMSTSFRRLPQELVTQISYGRARDLDCIWGIPKTFKRVNIDDSCTDIHMYRYIPVCIYKW